MPPHPAVAACRLAVRRAVADLPAEALILLACSGGVDSLALSAAGLWEIPRRGRRAGVVCVDHGLQPGSDARATQVTAWAAGLGAAPTEVLTVQVRGDGGPEAAARRARYAALDAACARHEAVAVLLAHTRDDQAETVLLGLARGSGTRALAGMAPRRGVYRRPLLQLPRSVTEEVCAVLDLRPWRDPHNADPAYARARVRSSALPALEAALGPGVAPALARSADHLRADADALDEWAAGVAAELGASSMQPGAVAVSALAALPAAIRRRVLLRAARAAGVPAGRLAAAHLAAMDALVVGWHGQRPVALPFGHAVSRECGWLRFRPPEER